MSVTAGTLSFETAEVPAGHGSPGRTAEPNPYVDLVAGMKVASKGDEGGALKTTVPFAEDSAEVRKIKAQLRAAAGSEKTIRVRTDSAGKGKTTLTIWATEKIKRSPKPNTAKADSPDASASSTPSSPAAEGAPVASDSADAPNGGETAAA